MADDLELPSRALRLRPSTTPHGPRNRTRSSTTIEPSSPRVNSPESIPPSPNPESLPAVIETETETPPTSSPSPPPAVRSLSKPPPLTIPSATSFESVLVQWKPLPLEAALWTFTSEELQHIVSRSIRSSAGESAIRLLSIENLDKVLPAELERLENAKLATQSKYRFLVHRRTMLLQGINSRAAAPAAAKDGEEAASTISALVAQLSQTVAECDEQVQELAKIYDQQAQIAKMLDIHWGSALAIALRKLNGSYGKRTSELNKAKGKISQLEGELEDAWKEAERLAQELDTLEMEGVSDGEEEVVISKAAVVSVPPTPNETHLPLPMVPTYFTVETSSRSGSRIALTRAPSPHTVPQKSPESPQTVPSEITPGVSRESSSTSSRIPPKNENTGAKPPIPPPKDDKYALRRPVNDDDDDDDAASIKSSKSAKSHLSVVSAARRRSLRVSQGSLRLTHTKINHAPPVPNLPVIKVPSKPNRFSTSLHSFKASRIFSSNSSSSAGSHSNAHQPNGSTSSRSEARQSNDSTVKSISSRSSAGVTPLQYVSDDPSSQYVMMDIQKRKRASLEDLHIVDSPTSDRFPREIRGVTADDIYVRPRRGTIADPASLNRLSRRMSTNDFSALGHGNDAQGPPKEVPSIWHSVDAPATPAERVESLLRRGSKRNPYNKLKTLTKRYSLPFPLFNANKAPAPIQRNHHQQTQL